MWKCLSSSSASRQAASQSLEPPARVRDVSGQRPCYPLGAGRKRGEGQEILSAESRRALLQTFESREEDDVLSGRKVVEEYICVPGCKGGRGGLGLVPRPRAYAKRLVPVPRAMALPSTMLRAHADEPASTAHVGLDAGPVDRRLARAPVRGEEAREQIHRCGFACEGQMAGTSPGQEPQRTHSVCQAAKPQSKAWSPHRPHCGPREKRFALRRDQTRCRSRL